MRDEYSALTLEHFHQPRNVSALPPAADVVRVQVGSRDQAAVFLFTARAREGRIAAVGWSAYGCPHALAAASWTSEWLAGREVAEVSEFDWRKVLQSLDIPENKSGKLLLLEDAVKALAEALVSRPVR